MGFLPDLLPEFIIMLYASKTMTSVTSVSSQNCVSKSMKILVGSSLHFFPVKIEKKKLFRFFISTGNHQKHGEYAVFTGTKTCYADESLSEKLNLEA